MKKGQREKHCQIVSSAKSRDFLDNIEKELDDYDNEKIRQMKKIHEEWNRNVYETIKSDIKKTVLKLDTNFRDSCSSTGSSNSQTPCSSPNFKPTLSRTPIKVSHALLKDPLNSFALEQREELNALGIKQGDKKNDSSTNGDYSREMLSPSLWAAGKIEATPHGIFSKMMNDSSGQHKDVTGSHGNPSNRSTLVLDHFNILRGREAVEREIPRGKRIQPIIKK